MNLIKKLLGSGAKANYAELVKQGATILDVRTTGEYHQGHIRGSVNIPLQMLQTNLSKINKQKPVITCCASGMRSASAKQILTSKGFSEVHNGGGWISLQNKII
ncbi:rhodanese-like domain-containing protein [soil metagenome]